MTLGSIATKARFLTSTDTSSWTDAQLLIDINIWYEKILSMILESADESDFDDARRGQGGSAGSTLNYPIQTTPMVSGQRDYTMPVSEQVLKIKRVDITYDGTNYFKAMPLDNGEVEFGLGNDANTDTNFNQSNPRYDIKYNSLFIYPAPTATDVSNGGKIRVEWERDFVLFTSSDYSSVLTDSTQVPGFDAMFHPMLAEGASLEYGRAKQYPQTPDWEKSLMDWEARLRTHYGRKELDRRLQATSVYDTAYGS